MAESRRDEIAKLEALYASNPDGRVFTHLAEAYRRAGELDRAREILDRGLQRHPDYPSAHVVLGRVYADLGRDEDAATSFRRVLELDPENLIARRSLAEAARAAGHDEDALRHYRELLEQDPSASEVREIVEELEVRLHGPPAPPPVMPSSWSTSRDEESWDAPEPTAPAAGLDGFDQGGFDQARLDAAPAAGDFDLSGTFGDATPDPSAPAPSPFDPVPLDLSGIDFGGAPAPVEPAEPQPADVGPDASGYDASGYDASGWGDWPAEQAPAGADAESGAIHMADIPAAESAAPADADHEGEPAGTEEAGPVQLPEPEPFSGRPTVEAPLEHEPVADATSGPADPVPHDEYTPGPRPRASDDFDAFGVPTETLAALYEAQGFPDRAAAVYRALLRERPDDERLRERARAADEAAAALRAQRTGIEETREVWVSGTADSWDSPPQPRTAYAWDEAEDDEEAGSPAPTIGDYLQRVLSWRPSDTPAEAADGEGLLPWDVAETAGPEAEQAPWADAGEIDAGDREDVLEPWAADEEEASGDLDTIDGYVFGGEPSDPADVAPAPGDGLEIEYGFGLAPGESAFGAHPPEPEPESGVDPRLPTDDEAAAPEAVEPEPFAFGEPREPEPVALGEGEPPENLPFEMPRQDSGLHLDTLLPLPPEHEIPEEQPDTWFEPTAEQPASDAQELPLDPEEAGAEAELPTAGPLPFGFEEDAREEPFAAGVGEPSFGFEEGAGDEPSAAGAEDAGFGSEEPTEAEPRQPVPSSSPFAFDDAADGPAEAVSEPLPFDFEQIGTEPDVPAPEPLPFDLAALGADLDDEPGEPLPFETQEIAEPAYEAGEPEADEAMLELQEAEAVNETAPPAVDVWDPTIALADVAPRPQPRQEAKLRFEGGARPESAPAPQAPAPAEEDAEDEDLEMFRAWLQSLKR